MTRGKVLVAQGGGPTAVINQSLVGVVLEARRQLGVGHKLDLTAVPVALDGRATAHRERSERDKPLAVGFRQR